MSMTETTTTAGDTDIEVALRDFIVENFFVEDEVDAHASLTDAGVIDSTGVLELVTWIEDTYGMQIPDADILPDNLDTIASIVRYVSAALGG